MGRKTAHGLTDQATVWVYIGPTIRSAIQQNSIHSGTREEVLKQLEYAIERYPQIASLLISAEELAEARKLIKQPGNRLYEAYRRFLNGLK